MLEASFIVRFLDNEESVSFRHRQESKTECVSSGLLSVFVIVCASTLLVSSLTRSSALHIRQRMGTATGSRMCHAGHSEVGNDFEV